MTLVQALVLFLAGLSRTPETTRATNSRHACCRVSLVFLQEQDEQEELRREKLAELKKLGIDPYPAEEFKINVTAHDIKENYERDKLNYKEMISGPGG